MKRRTFLLAPFALAVAGDTPDILIVVARGWRGVATPWNGDRDVRAPRLEAFAKDAVVFPRAYAASPNPDKARTAILTGRFPHAPGDAAQLKARVVVIDGEPSGGEAVRHFRDNVAEEAQPKVREELSAAYARYSSMDTKFGELVDSVDAKTTVVFTSDAGEMLGSHELDGDDSFYEESARVPMAIRAPGLKPSASEFLVSHVDILPTLLGLAGEAPVPGVQGRDLSRGERPEFVFAEGRLGQRDEWRMLVLGMDKLVVDAAGDVLHMFNLAADPYELRDLARDPAAQLKRAQLMAVMRSERSRLLDFRRR